MSNVFEYQPKPIPVRPRKSVRPHILLSGRNLSHTPVARGRGQHSRPPGSGGARERAALAAAWINGELTLIKPTVTLAAKVFGVSQVTIDAARKVMPKGTAAPMVGAIWDSMFGIDRDQFIAERADEIMASLDRLTTKTA